MSSLRRPDDKNVADALNSINKRLDSLEKRGISEVSIEDDGYVVLAGGLIIQWGKVTDAGDAGSITFLKPFPKACLNVSLTGLYFSFLIGLTLSSLPTNTGVEYKMTSSSDVIFWIAIGY